MLNFEDNVRAILESNLTEIKDEILDTIVENILNLKEDTKIAEPRRRALYIWLLLQAGKL